MPFYYINKALVILNRTALYVQKPLKSCQNWSKSKPLQCFWNQMSSDIYARKVSIKKFLEKSLETYVSKTSRKKSLCKQKLLKKLWNLCEQKKSFETYARKKFKKKSFETRARKNFWDFKKNVMQIFESYFLILCRSCQKFL